MLVLNKKQITVFGKSFETMKELCDYHKISERTFRYRIKDLGLSPEDAVMFGRNGRNVAIRGVVYKSQEDCLIALGITKKMLRYQKDCSKCTFHEAVEKILTKREKDVDLDPIKLFR